MSTVVDTDAYINLLLTKLPKVIETRKEHDEFVLILETLDDKGASMTPEERQYADLLTLLIEKFEERARPPSKRTPLRTLRFYMDQHDLKQADLLDVFGSSGIASEVMQGKRDLSKTHIRKLAQRFNVSPATFFQTL